MLILSVCVSLCLSHQKVMNGTSKQNIPFTKMANSTKTALGVDRMHGSKDGEREPLEPSIIITVNPHPSCYYGAILTKLVVLLGKVRYMYGLVVLCSQTLLNWRRVWSTAYQQSVATCTYTSLWPQKGWAMSTWWPQCLHYMVIWWSYHQSGCINHTHA